MNRHSIFFKLNLLFITATVVTLIAGVLMYHQLDRQNMMSMMLKSRLVMQEIRRTGHLSDEFLQNTGLQKVPKKDYKNILKNGAFIHRMNMYSMQKRHYFKGFIIYKSNKYIFIKTPEKQLLLYSEDSNSDIYLIPISVFSVIFILLLFSYITLRKSLIPIRRLEDDIRNYGDGGELVYKESFTNGKDEISSIAKAFYDSADRLKRYGSARRLFLRNLLHELNTPVTKGRLTAELSQEPRTRRMLSSIFDRLSVLLNELVEIEKIASDSEPFNYREEVSVDEITDEACRRLYCEKIDRDIPQNATIFVDKEAMVIVFKNLIDNAYKYGKNPKVIMRESQILFVSEGKELQYPLSHYTEPFRQEYEGDKEGFGLGLYIVKEIVERHGMNLLYKYENGINIFTLF